MKTFQDMTKEEKITALKNLGGNEWISGEQHRIYLNENIMCDALGLTVSRYGSGAIKSAMINGEKISNSTASKIFFGLSGFYYNAAKNTIGAKFDLTASTKEAWANIKAKVESL